MPFLKTSQYFGVIILFTAIPTSVYIYILCFNLCVNPAVFMLEFPPCGTIKGICILLFILDITE